MAVVVVIGTLVGRIHTTTDISAVQDCLAPYAQVYREMAAADSLQLAAPAAPVAEHNQSDSRNYKVGVAGIAALAAMLGLHGTCRSDLQAEVAGTAELAAKTADAGMTGVAA